MLDEWTTAMEGLPGRFRSPSAPPVPEAIHLEVAELCASVARLLAIARSPGSPRELRIAAVNVAHDAQVAVRDLFVSASWLAVGRRPA